MAKAKKEKVVTPEVKAPEATPEVKLVTPEVTSLPKASEAPIVTPIAAIPVVVAPIVDEVVKPEPDEIVIELLKADETTRNFTYYTKLSIENAMKAFRFDSTLPVVLHITDWDKNDLVYLKKDKLSYNEATGVLSVRLPIEVKKRAPGFFVTPHLYTERTRDLRNQQDQVTRVIDSFYFHEIVVSKLPGTFKDLKHQLV